MARFVWTLAAVLVAGPVTGQGLWGPDSGQAPKVPVRKLTISPAAAPIPALKYQLLPELRETTPGNAALLYYRAFSPEWSHNIRANADLQKTIDDALDRSPAELKALADLHFVRGWMMLKEIDRAARRSYCDWELSPRVREDGIWLLIPDVQELRKFAKYLKLRAKLELADKRFDEAAYTLQTGLQLGRHAAHGPTLIQALVGVAITAVMSQEVEDWVQVSDSPNLYWALTDLPTPYIDLRMPLQGEKLFIDSMLPGYREALADPAKVPPPFTAEQRKKMIEGFNGTQLSGLASDATFMLLAGKMYPAAKAYLQEHGRSAEQVEAMPALTAVLLYEVAEYDLLYDEMLKAHGLPYWLARPVLEQADQRLKEEVVRSGSPGMSMAGILMPAIRSVTFAQVRTDRNIAMLRTVEALRLYAAAHGSLPDKLADVTEVPVPPSPVTGKPFDYRREGDAAVLTDPPADKDPRSITNALRYEITLRK
jgi:hypothetical protein